MGMYQTMPSSGRKRETYHHGNLREALIQEALATIAERGLAGLAVAELARAIGVSPSAPYRHFRDRNAVVAEVARRGFERLGAELEATRRAGGPHPTAALERCAQAQLAFASREGPMYAAMFEAGFPSKDYPEVIRARTAAFAVVRRAAQEACERVPTERRPPALMVALHTWSLAHGTADLFAGHDGDGRDLIPMPPEELLEAGLLVYLRSLDLPVADRAA